MSDRALTRRDFVATASVLGISLFLPTCVSDPVTERDIEVARQMGAPDDVMASLEEGQVARRLRTL